MGNPKRDRILEQTRKEFMESGYSGFTMDDISAKTGISKATIYKYFPGKHDLIKGLVMDKLNEDLGKLQEVMKPGKGFIVSLVESLKLAREKMDFFRNHVLKDLEKNAPDILDLIRQTREERMPGFVSELLARGKEEKRIKENVNPDMVAYAMLVLSREFTKIETMERFNLDFPSFHEFLMNLTLGGILTRSGEKELQKFMDS